MQNFRLITVLILATVATLAATAVHATEWASSDSDWIPSGTMVTQSSEYSFRPDPNPDGVKNLWFATIPPAYLMDRAEFFAGNGLSGVMMDGIMNGWRGDVWKQPTRYTPGVEAPGGRIVGEDNPLFQLCRRMNERCREVGIEYNSVKVSFGTPIPDWFDDEAWAPILENFRQGAIFARMAGFAGMALDVEYVYPEYELSHPRYQVEGYPRDRLVAQAYTRGYQMMHAMITEFPDMINWQLPETVWSYGPLADAMFVGMLKALAERDAPGGLHASTELYCVTDPEELLLQLHAIDVTIREAIRQYGDEQTMDYWMRRCTLNTGMWPLGYYRHIADRRNRFLGYGGKYENFSDRIIGSYSDKSENYSPEDFRRQYAAARLICPRFTWVYCHGQVFWQMTEEEAERYHGCRGDRLPIVRNIDDYFAVLRDRVILDDENFARRAALVRDHGDLTFPGSPPFWWHIGPFPVEGNSAGGFVAHFAPEDSVDIHATYPAYPGSDAPDSTLRWRRFVTPEDGLVDLKARVSNLDFQLAYSAAWAEVDEPTRVQFRVGNNDFMQIFVNGEEVFARLSPRNVVRDHDTFWVNLPAGRSTILVKVGNLRRVWGFFLRVTDENGDAVESIRWVEPE